MNRPFSGWIVSLSVLLLLSGLALILVEDWRTESERGESHLVQSIGEILRLDEVLTMSARYFSVTRNNAYRDRYLQNVGALDRVIEKTFALAPSDSAITALRETENANAALVRMETSAFELADSGHQEEAAALLEGSPYRQEKGNYARGMERAFDLLTETAARRTRIFRYVFYCLAAFLVLNLTFVLIFLHRSRVHAMEFDRKKAELEALHVTMATVMDVFGNTLNGLQLFRIKAEDGAQLSKDDIKLFDQIVFQANESLQAMGSMPEFRSRVQGHKKMLDFEGKS